MSTPAPSPRHLQRDGLEEYLRAGAPAVVVIEGDPPAQLAIEPYEDRLTLRIRSTSGEPPDLHAYRHFESDSSTIEGTRWLELTVAGRDMLLDAYPVLCAVADRVQQDDAPFATAVLDALERYRQILQGLRKLGEDQELGLFGELLVLEHLAVEIGPQHAIDAWRGPSREEHDFGLPLHDLEVKSTISENRHHWVQGVHQLEPTAERSLWLVSLQLTTAGDGGRTLPMLIDDVRAGFNHRREQDQYEEGLALAGWTEEQSASLTRRLRLRSLPLILAVDAEFPALTTKTLSVADLPVERFRQVHYQIDLSGLSVAAPPPPEIAGLGLREERS